MGWDAKPTWPAVSYFRFPDTEDYSSNTHSTAKTVVRGTLDATLAMDVTITYDLDRDKGTQWAKFLLVPVSLLPIINITNVSKEVNAEYIILWLNDDNATWKSRFKFWWRQEIEGFPMEKLSNTKQTAPPYFLAVQSDAGEGK